MRRSLRRRAILAGLVWAALAFAGSGLVLNRIMDSIIVNRFDGLLAETFFKLGAAVSNAGDSVAAIALHMSDPAYNRPYSGRYWQAIAPDGTIHSSRSLFDALLEARPEEIDHKGYWTGQGPGERLRGIMRVVVIEDSGPWRLTVANSVGELQGERQRIRTSITLAFGILGALGVLAAALLTSFSLQPLNQLRADVVNRWNSGKRLVPEDYPDEVSPLVADLNEVLDRNTGIIDRARRRAADMAHALNTPVAILKNELLSLGQNGADTTRASEALERIEAQLSRSLARIRAVNAAEGSGISVPLDQSFARLGRAFATLTRGSGKSIDLACPPGIDVFMDREELEEALGNILDNALKWCRSRVEAQAAAGERMIEITVEDDGPGIPDADRREALRAGGRLDHASPGTGLGLAIVSDYAQAYAGDLELGRSDRLGGLMVRLCLPGRVRPDVN